MEWLRRMQEGRAESVEEDPGKDLYRTESERVRKEELTPVNGVHPESLLEEEALTLTLFSPEQSVRLSYPRTLGESPHSKCLEEVIEPELSVFLTDKGASLSL